MRSEESRRSWSAVFTSAYRVTTQPRRMSLQCAGSCAWRTWNAGYGSAMTSGRLGSYDIAAGVMESAEAVEGFTPNAPDFKEDLPNHGAASTSTTGISFEA